MWAGFLGILVWGTLAPLLGSILPNLRQRSGLSLADSGVMFVALSSGMVVASLAAGPLLDRYGKKVVLCGAVAVIGIVLVFFEFVRSPNLLVALGFASISGTSIGLAVTAGWFGSFAVSPTFGFVAQGTSFSTGYLVILGTSAAMLLVALVLARQEARSRRVPAAIPGLASS